MVLLVELIAFVEDPVEWCWGQIGGVRVHVAQEEEEGLVACSKAAQLGQRHIVHVLGFRETPLVDGTPVVIVDVVLVAACGGVSLEANAGGLIACLAQDFRQRLALDVTFVA